MKKALQIAGVFSLIALAGCSSNQAEDNSDILTNTSGPTKVNSPAQYYDQDYQRMDSDKDTKDFGFVRVNRSMVYGKDNTTRSPSIDREQMADVVSQLAVQVPNVNDVSTLVTDEEVLIVYETDTKNRMETADQVKKTAFSVMPRYYHVYVSDNVALRQYIENYSIHNTGTGDIDHSIEQTIKEMKKAPQGRPLNNMEDTNGKLKDEMD